MSLRTVYQTLRDRNNNDEVIQHGPYICNKSNAWLHNGYYFWEEFIEPAHHWGKNWCHNKYIITKGDCFIAPDDLFDLAGNMRHIREVSEIFEYLKEEGLATDETSVSHVIDFLQKLDCFDYLASRTNTTNAFKKKYDMDLLKYDINSDTFFVMRPAVQICIYDLEKASFKNFQIVYPEDVQSA